ncbi:aromatic prenyltransferase [Streptomyces sp. NPDC049040]|uniref:aromatic prenyltransferase n=1 Tax=Streptomyces sp. NPDC049040 TaxID=3365593 RepID=UPI0037177E71
MSTTGELEELLSAIEESARVVEVPYAYDTVRSVLDAYREALPGAPISCRLGTGKRAPSDVDWHVQLPKGDLDPYVIALAYGLIDSTDHPVALLFLEVAERCDVCFYGIDFGAANGLKKIYAAFPPDDMEPLFTLLDLPSMPSSMAENYDFFARHGMGGKQIDLFGIDYRHRTVNLHFTGLSADTLAPESVRSIFRDMEFPEPSEGLLRLSGQAIGAYATLSWDSPKIERFAFSFMAKDPADLPVPMEPGIERFMTDIRRRAGHDTILYCAAMTPAGEEVYTFQLYYQSKPWLTSMPKAGSIDDQAAELPSACTEGTA